VKNKTEDNSSTLTISVDDEWDFTSINNFSDSTITIDGISVTEHEHRKNIKKKLPIDILHKLDPELIKE
jgi:hypothetical protein|tara:strand:- start:170 stop:376 length:207 start_codon:yes stop_codon:yes gene_type:complete